MAVPNTYKQGRDKNAAGQRGLDEVAAAKRAAALRDPGKDRSRENLEKAKRGEWK